MRNVKAHFEPEDMQLVIRLYEEGYSTREIAEMTNLTFQEVIVLLKRVEKDISIPDRISYAYITDPKILIVSDTHIGSKFENMDYIREAYKYAQEHDIHTVLHGGDLIQSTVKNVKREYIDEQAQIEHVIEDYPYSDTIQTLILLGNHDYLTFRKDPKYLEMLKARKDFNIMGYRRIYLTWLKSLISVYHTVKKFPFIMPALETDLTLRGHSHHLTYNKEDGLNIPSLSNDMLQNKDARPGFLVGSKSDSYINIRSFYFTNSLHEEGKVLTKKLK